MQPRQANCAARTWPPPAKALRVHCPVQVLVGDLETAAGFPELVRRFDDRQRRQLLGRRFPLSAAVP